MYAAHLAVVKGRGGVRLGYLSLAPCHHHDADRWRLRIVTVRPAAQCPCAMCVSVGGGQEGGKASSGWSSLAEHDGGGVVGLLIDEAHRLVCVGVGVLMHVVTHMWPQSKQP